jgi:hypothetical protein
MPAFLPALTIAAINLITIATAAEWRPQFLSACQNGCAQHGGFSTDACLQICNCMASELEAKFSTETLGSIDPPSAEQLRQTNEIRTLCVRLVLGR